MRSKEDIFEMKIHFYKAIRNFLLIYARNNIGSRIEVNDKRLAEYLSSDRFFIQTGINYPSEEEIHRQIEEDLINGLPVWQFLELTDYQKKFLKEEYESNLKEAIEKEKERLKQSKCSDCIFYSAKETKGGVFRRCKTSVRVNGKRYRRSVFSSRRIKPLRYECEEYIKKP